MLCNFILSFFFSFFIVNASLHHSKVPARRGFFLKANVPASDIGTPSTTNDSSTTKEYPQPDPYANTTCSNSAGKPVNFIDRECWYAAKVMAEDGTSTSQCGTCVLGLIDADKKKTFKPTGPLNVTFIQEQAMKLLDGCKNNNGSPAPKVSKRDSSPSDSNNPTNSNNLLSNNDSNNSSKPTTDANDPEEANVQLLIGHGTKSKSCPGL